MKKLTKYDEGYNECLKDLNLGSNMINDKQMLFYWIGDKRKAPSEIEGVREYVKIYALDDQEYTLIDETKFEDTKGFRKTIYGKGNRILGFWNLGYGYFIFKNCEEEFLNIKLVELSDK